MIVCFLLSLSSAVNGSDSTPRLSDYFPEAKAEISETKQENKLLNDNSTENPFNESYTVELENLTATFNQTKYHPGTGVNISIKGIENRLNADLTYELLSPIDEIAFKFQHIPEIIFEDPNFLNENVTEWVNDTTNGFDNITIYNGKLLLELNGTGYARTYFNNASLSGTYRVKFAYQNLTNINETLPNENLKFLYWDGQDFVEEALNYSVAGELQFDKILYLNITGVSNPDDILFAFVLDSTENTFKNWTIDNLEVENYNLAIFQDPDFDGTSILDWFNGTYAFNETKIESEGAESYLALSQFVGEGEIFYNLTSIKDDVIIEFDYRNTTANASKLVFEYWNGSDWIATYLNGTSDSEWEHKILLAMLNGWNEAEDYSIFRFKVNATVASTWNIDNIRVVPLNEPGFALPVVDLAMPYRSTKNYTWAHEGVNATISVVSDIFRNGTEPVWLNITFNLPAEKVILGNWTLRIYTLAGPTSPDTLADVFALPFEVTSDIEFIKRTAFARRGNFNTTEPGIVEEPYLASSDAIFSPGEEVYFMGQLNMTWTKEILWANYTEIGTFNNTVGPSYENAISPTWTGTNTSIDLSTIKWEPGILQAFNPDGSNLANGAFEAPYNETTYFLLSIKIPERGIFGKVNNTLVVKFAKDEPKGASIEIPIELNIKYFVNITRGMNVTAPGFPETLQLSSWVEGNLSIQPISWNASPSVSMPWNDSYVNYTKTTEENETLALVNVTDILNISLEDIHFDIILNTTNFEAHPFQIRRTNNTIFWAGRLDPNLPTGTYTLRFIWNDPASVDEPELGFLEWAIKGADHYHLVQIGIFGTLGITTISEDLSVRQGETLEVAFKVAYQENGAFVSGLYIYANTTRSGDKILVTESNNMYFFSITATIDEELGQLSVYLFKLQTNEKIGEISINIKSRQIESTDQEESPLVLPIALIIVAIILASFGLLASKIVR
ncbi:MAG: hypothetical protein JSV05_02890 [Candidatus Bathyarchaeota archaeon]|nr:MAG: hypothetical protein JSV05_02890 [Candidatus Bathyarchaeota archaeon]